MNADLIIAKYLALRNHIDARTKAFEAEMKPYTDALSALETVGSGMLIAQGGDEGKSNIVTPSGTMYRKRWTAVKITDRPTWLRFIYDDFNNRSAFLTSAVAKKEVEDFIETNKVIPPGLDISRGYKTHFNSPKG